MNLKKLSAAWNPVESFPTNFISSLPEETFNYGKKLAAYLSKGSIVALYGPLGSGKTCFTKGIASALGVEDEITSPTYTIVSEHEGRDFLLYHIDAYRLTGSEDFYGIGGEEIIYGNGISVIEWSENIENFIPDSAFRVNIKILSDCERQINIYRGNE